MNRPNLNKIDLKKVLQFKKGIIITMLTGQWDKILEKIYEENGILLEVNEEEIPIEAYQKRCEK
jgi:hypothetical protein